jgi:hypothetical protein
VESIDALSDSLSALWLFPILLFVTQLIWSAFVIGKGLKKLKKGAFGCTLVKSVVVFLFALCIVLFGFRMDKDINSIDSDSIKFIVKNECSTDYVI